MVRSPFNSDRTGYLPIPAYGRTCEVRLSIHPLYLRSWSGEGEKKSCPRHMLTVALPSSSSLHCPSPSGVLDAFIRCIQKRHSSYLHNASRVIGWVLFFDKGVFPFGSQDSQLETAAAKWLRDRSIHLCILFFQQPTRLADGLGMKENPFLPVQDSPLLSWVPRFRADGIRLSGVHTPYNHVIPDVACLSRARSRPAIKILVNDLAQRLACLVAL